ncbi:lipid II:glycine glycyltransferase FemX [Canibacter zhoujuaniae]|uniref:lipid II:glycine glycyltransferase FemX n=1 Tax=Canibacter zhoujuaniae TaxID=2708343 RepID=UPI0014249672|nr:peptidoglycan bridge formation glycyltransferase FemA/FemB family protein [Canibacter zhoujuaniae]
MTSVYTVRAASRAEQENWDELSEQNPLGGEFSNSRVFARVKSQYGWHPRFLIWETDGKPAFAGLVLERRIPLLGKFWYLPTAPALQDAAEVGAGLKALEEYVKTHEPTVFAVSAEPTLPVIPADDPDTVAGRHTLPPSFASLIPEKEALDTIKSRLSVPVTDLKRGRMDAITAVIDLDQTADELLASFDKKCRNMVRRGEREGVEFRELPATQETFDKMWKLMHKVGGGRTDLVIRPRAYLESYWKGFADQGRGRFYAAVDNGEISVLAFVVLTGKNATYKDGGSDRALQSAGSANYLHWRIMLEMQKLGATSYNMFGVAPVTAQSDTDHINYSLGRFKLSFSKRRSTLVGRVELIFNETKYKLWSRVGAGIASRLHARKYKDSQMI